MYKIIYFLYRLVGIISSDAVIIIITIKIMFISLYIGWWGLYLVHAYESMHLIPDNRSLFHFVASIVCSTEKFLYNKVSPFYLQIQCCLQELFHLPEILQ